MARPDWIGVGGIVLALIFGVPSVSVLVQGDLALGAVTLLLAFVILGLTIYIYKTSTASPYTILKNSTHVEIGDDLGKTALLRKSLSLRPNHSGQQFFTYRNISCDGDLANVRVDPKVELVKHEVQGGDDHITVRFSNHLQKFKPVETWIEVDLRDCFIKDNEGGVVVIDQPTKSVHMDFVFPDNRIPNAAAFTATYRSNGLDEPLNAPVLNGNQASWSFSRRMRNLKGGEYAVMWQW